MKKSTAFVKLSTFCFSITDGLINKIKESDYCIICSVM